MPRGSFSERPPICSNGKSEATSNNAQHEATLLLLDTQTRNQLYDTRHAHHLRATWSGSVAKGAAASSYGLLRIAQLVFTEEYLIFDEESW